MPGRGRSRRTPSDAEKTLWRAATRDVRPIDTDRAPDAPPAPPAPPLQAPQTAPAASSTPPLAAPRKPGPVDRATLERLKRGQVAIEARIDLHGMDQREAFTALTGFIDASARLGRRSLLVITGKGALLEGGGVLRRNAPAWLMASPFAPRILTIAAAHARHGGDGAFYVLLRRPGKASRDPDRET
jgi:DNA-nicking Smr family endonuclease